jgi:hypothetical protein
MASLRYLGAALRSDEPLHGSTERLRDELTRSLDLPVSGAANDTEG